ncbi:hypothetical protein HY024_05095 [Candidatus Curtissbacteria bacterium]|nr:hypothetical protein [Candidatus Curtissbacteria bacterium]
MTRNPFINAFAATFYITIVASVMFYGTEHNHPNNTIIVPIAVLSLFTLSAAVMAYLFLYQPLQLYLDGKKKNAVNFFLQTIAAFGGITILVFALLFSGVFR